MIRLELGPPTAPVRHAAPDDVTQVAAGLAFPEGPIACADGSLLVVEVRGGTLTRVDPSGALERIVDLGGGPNGAAVGPDGAVYVCNNGGLPWADLPDGSMYPIDTATGSMTPAGYTHGWIERVDVAHATTERVYESCDGRPLSAPNDLAFAADGELWFTDTGKSDAWSTVVGVVYRCQPDGSEIRAAAHGLLGPNGIGITPDGEDLVVADTPTGRVWRWSLAAESLSGATPRAHGGEAFATFPGAVALDSLALDGEGRVLVALPGHRALGVVAPDGGLAIVELPGVMPTNACFGGPDGTTVFVTVGGTGEILSFAWPCPGAALPFTID